MMSEHNSRVMEGDCWLAYFDLLGFTPRVRDFAQHWYANGMGGLNMLAGEYTEKVLRIVEEEITRQRLRGSVLYYAHFSDTFILYAPGESFESLNLAANSVFADVVYNVGPLRGALTWGRFYADRDRSIFVGPALIDAYACAEGQDWIGYVLTPQAVEQLSKMKSPDWRPGNYVWWKVPVKVEKTVNSWGEKMVMVRRKQLLAFQIASIPRIHEIIRSMKNETRAESRENYRRCRSKYLRTLLFIRHTQSMRSSRLTME